MYSKVSYNSICISICIYYTASTSPWIDKITYVKQSNRQTKKNNFKIFFVLIQLIWLIYKIDFKYLDALAQHYSQMITQLPYPREDLITTALWTLYYH